MLWSGLREMHVEQTVIQIWGKNKCIIYFSHTKTETFSLMTWLRTSLRAPGILTFGGRTKESQENGARFNSGVHEKFDADNECSLGWMGEIKAFGFGNVEITGDKNLTGADFWRNGKESYRDRRYKPSLIACPSMTVIPSMVSKPLLIG